MHPRQSSVVVQFPFGTAGAEKQDPVVKSQRRVCIVLYWIVCQSSFMPEQRLFLEETVAARGACFMTFTRADLTDAE
jgi:hypothetical protein